MRRLFFVFVICCAPLTAFEGLYVGGSLGGHLTEATGSNEVVGSTQGAPFQPFVQNELFDRGATGMLYAGYGLNWCSFYLAAEGFVQFSAATMRETHHDIHLSDSDEIFQIPGETKAQVECCQGGVDLLPGWSPNCSTLLYGRIGVSCAKTTLKTQNTNVGFGPQVGSWDLLLALSKSRTCAAFRAGAGLEQSLTPRLALRADYIYTDYGKISVRGFREGVTTVNIPVTVSNDTSLHLYDHAVLLGLTYRWSCLDSANWNECCTYSDYDGFYVGGAIGGGNIYSSQHGDVVSNRAAIAEFQVAELPSQLYNDQFQGMLYLGYGKSCNCLYLGAELFASGATNQSMHAAGESRYMNGADLYLTSFDAAVEASSWQYGLDLRPGVRLAPRTLLYSRVGVSAAEIKARANAVNSGSFAGTWSVPVEASESTWKAAFRLGLGVEHALCSKLHLRADYIFTNFGIASFKKTGIGEDTEQRQVTVRETLSTHIQNHGVVAGLSYYFCR